MIDNLSVLMLDGEANVSLCVARCLARVPNLKLHILSKNTWDPIRFSRHRSTYCVQEIRNNDKSVLDAIGKRIRQTGPDIVLPVTEPGIRFVSTHREFFAEIAAIPPTPEFNVLDTVVDKWLLADFMMKYNIPCPHTILITADEKFEHALCEMSFPVLLKPTRGSDGRNIQYFNDRDTLMNFLKGNQEVARQYIIQNFIHGYDIDCSVLCQDGNILAYTIQKGFIPCLRRFTPPAGIEFLEDSQTLDVVGRLMSTLKWSGVAHIDLRFDERYKQVKVLEINARYWNSLLGSLVVGVNFPYLACLAGLGISFPRPEYRKGRFVTSNYIAMKKLIQRYLGRGKADFSFGETNLRYVLADPFPEIMNFVEKRF